MNHALALAASTLQPTSTQSFDFVSIILVAGVGVIVFIALLAFTARYLQRKACQMRNATA